MKSIQETFTKKKPYPKIINILDIDGCILESAFPNLKERVASVDEMKEKLFQTNLFSNFISYYCTISEQTFKNIFITGRKESHFKKETEWNLKILNAISTPFTVVYYPDEKEHSPWNYYNFKINQISNIILSYSQNHHKFIFRIFDDDASYFEDLVTHFANTPECDCYNFILYQVQSNEDWANLEDKIFSIYDTGEIQTYV
jgi:hypothetical protein